MSKKKKDSYLLAKGPRAATREGPVDVGTTWRLPNSGVGGGKGDPYVLGDRELRARRDTDFATVADGSTTNGEVVAVLDEDGVVAVVGEVDGGDDRSAGLRNAEDSTSTAAGNDLVDVDVGVVVAVGVLAVVVGHAEGGVTVAGSDVLAVHETNPSIGGLLEEQATLAHVASVDGVDV